MAGSLTISYTPQLTSSGVSSSPFICHRICYRQGSVGVYCCIEDTTDSIAGTPKTFNIVIEAAPCGTVPDVDVESCIDTVYEGYVQACCEAEDSLAGRVDWSATYVADPSCVNKEICCVSQRALIDAYITITDSGTGYNDALSPLSVTVVRDPSDPVAAGGVNDAVVTATVAGGIVTVLTVTTPGLYGMTPLLVIPSPTLGSPGTTATAILVIPCADNRYKGNCNTSPQEVESVTLLLGECVNVCLPRALPFVYSAADLSGLPDMTDFSYSAGGCCDCTTCRDYIVVTGSDLVSINLCYTSCSDGINNAEEVCSSVPGSGVNNLSCVVPGSIYSPDDAGAILSITDDGAGSCC